jgi:hypothetical protein
VKVSFCAEAGVAQNASAPSKSASFEIFMPDLLGGTCVGRILDAP